MARFLLLGNFTDLQTGIYIHESIKELGHTVDYIDIRRLITEKGLDDGQAQILTYANQLGYKPDVILVLKGLELTNDTLDALKEKFPKAKLINWYFDIKGRIDDAWKELAFLEMVKHYDTFFCSLRGVAGELKKQDLKNVSFLGEACYPTLHCEQSFNFFQEKKYGADVSFVGSLGYMEIHPDRLPILDHVVSEGFDIKIWGPVVCEYKYIPKSVRAHLTEELVINERHAILCQTSLINLGLDANPKLDGSFSARIYRIMAAGGLYLSTNTKGLSDFFKLNAPGEEITADQELVVFYDKPDLIKKMDFLLENDDIRESIAKNGQKVVLAKHTFVHRIDELLRVIDYGRNKR